jgi:ketosteroid isomerase-like protein
MEQLVASVFDQDCAGKLFHQSIRLNGGEIQMSDRNKAILEEANARVAEGDYDGFLSFCTDDTEWTFVGDRTLKGKEAVRHYMATTYIEPPQFTVANPIAEGDFLTVVGEITIKDEDGKPTHYSYCDVWRFRGDKMVELKAFVIKIV